MTPTQQPAAAAAPGSAGRGTNRAGFIVGIVIALLAIGGVSNLLSNDGDRDPSGLTADVDRTPEPTPRRTPRPTPERTPEPTLNAGALEFQLFAAHLTDIAPDLVGGMQEVASDATNLDVDALQVSSVDLWLALGEEVDWLEQNGPHACFSDLHAKWYDAVSTLYDALDQISDGAIYYDVDLLNSGTDVLLRGNDLVNEATAMTAAAAAACEN